MGPHDKLPRIDLELKVRLHEVCFHHSEPGGRQDSISQQGALTAIPAIHASETAPDHAKYDSTSWWLSECRW